jgi:hypothetical protein
MKIRPAGAVLLHANENTCKRTDGRTDRTKLLVTFHDFAKTPKNWSRNKYRPKVKLEIPSLHHSSTNDAKHSL